MSVLRCDVVVVGGGPAGLATAVALRRMDHTVTVLERTDYLAPRVGEHIPPGAKTVLASLGLADVIASERHAACPGIRSVWGSDEPQDRDYLFHVAGEGLNLSRPEFDRDFAALAGRAGATVLTRARLTHLSRAGGLWDLSAQHAGGPAEIRCRVVVDATGRAASVAKRLGALPIVYDELVGIVGNVAVAKRGNHLVLIEALPDGWWYSAGLADDRVIATFLTDPERTETSRAARSDFWHARLGAARLTAERTGSIDRTGDLQVRTARTQRLDEAAGEGWLAVGDAAMSFDPLSSEGISKGLEWGTKAAVTAAALCRGDQSAAQAYRYEIGKTFADYLVTRYRYYAVEKRWPNAPFWRRRQQPPAPIKLVGPAG